MVGVDQTPAPDGPKMLVPLAVLPMIVAGPSIVYVFHACCPSVSRSATSSIVSYTLGISRVEPIAHNLLFERFINEGRTSYPDVDIDFSSERREEVTTEGGLAVAGQEARIKPVAQALTEAGIRVSLFIEPSEAQVEAAAAVAGPVLEAGGIAQRVDEERVAAGEVRIPVECADELGEGEGNEIADVRKKVKGIHVLHGLEVDILGDGAQRLLPLVTETMREVKERVGLH